MVGYWYIDGIDIYTTYRVGITKDGINDLFIFPAMKDMYSNSWPENDGVDIDLSDPKLKNKTVGISFASVTQDNEKIDDFLDFLITPGYRTLTVTSIGRSWSLRLNKESARNVEPNCQEFTLQFYDDFPRDLLLIYPYVLGSETKDLIITQDDKFLISMSNSKTTARGHGFNMLRSDYQIDDISFSDYGLIVNKGRSEVYKMPDMKTNLEVDINTQDGVAYNTSFYAFKEKDVTLECSFYTSTLDMFWNNYVAFFSALVQPEERLLDINYMNDVFECYYKSSSNFKFIKHPSYILCQFSLTLVFINSRPKKTINVLGSESKEIITTEDIDFIIQM